MSPKVAIVVLNWNGRKYLQQFLPSVMTTSYENWELVLADNASTDDSVSFVRENFPSVKIISLEKNYGFAKGYNEALKKVESDYYVLLNSDVEVSPGWVEPIIELMEKDKNIGAVQPKILSYNNKEKFEYAGAAGGWIDRYGYPFARGRIFDLCEEDLGQYDSSAPVFWASGASMFVRATLFHRLGGLDQYFFAHMEEIDFCWRLQLAGHQVWACPKSTVYHLGAGTLQKESPRKLFLNFRNNLIMMYKNLPTGQGFWIIFFRLILDGISAFRFLFGGNTAYFFAIIKAHYAFFYWILFRKKESVFPSSFKGKPEGWLNGSIVWQYFVKGKKTFTEIIVNKN